MTAQPGRFITFEGIDGAGKSTHVGWLAAHLRACGKTVVETREPGGTAVGEALREILLHQAMHLETEALLMFAARRENIAQVIAPALARGDWVLCDRFTDASFAYQGGGKGLRLDKLAALEHWVHAGLQPDLTLLFDVPTSTAQARLASARNPDKFEREGREFFENVRQEYLRRAEESPRRFAVIDSTRTVAEIRETLQKTIADILQQNEERLNKLL